MFKNDLIIRDNNLLTIIPYIDLKLIKIICGVRRSGKSYFLDMIADELIKQGKSEKNIIYRLYSSIEVEEGFSALDMYNELKNEIDLKEKYYLLLDEVQEIYNWEKCINTLFETFDLDIYVTGSNSSLTEEKISSYLSGRYIIIPQFTLSFNEYISFTNQTNKDIDEVYSEYSTIGGFPIIGANHINQKQAYQIVDGIYNSIITRDILKNHPIRDIEKFNRVVRFIIENVGKSFSANSISEYLKNQHREISVETIYNYIKWLEDSFIIYRCNRYDIRGKEILKTQEKYYLSDISFRFALFGYNHNMDDAILENIIYLELRRRGYKIYVGKIDNKEIDFIAQNKDDEIHIQAAVKMPIDSNREIENLQQIKDHYHKYVVTTNRNDCEIVNGIKVIHIADFLQMEQW